MPKKRKSSKKKTKIAENTVLILSSPEKDTILKSRAHKRRREMEIPLDESPLRSIFCLKKIDDMSSIEKKEDCFILDFNPFNPVDISKLPAVNGCDGDDAYLTIVAESGQVACRDYPHSRHLCLKFPFETTHHDTHCHLCYCYVCDLAAPCESWLHHCHASAHSEAWNTLRRIQKAQPRKS